MKHAPDPNEVTKTEACRAFARMMNTLNFSVLEPWLADDFQYASQWIFEELTSKAAYKAYIVPKLNTIRRSGGRVWAELAFTDVLGAGACVVIAQGNRDNLLATLLVTMRGEQISRMDLCETPAPQECRRTGEVPT